ncbi:helix-turn-helix domain-containing protein [Streptomyces sp. NPDC006923]|uniref:winged helix-turn-helix transcriptional regulator n=1 Tax=Streptomyces sp. NPDC006923 TaxID=3155355 RepID=UPI0033E0542A
MDTKDLGDTDGGGSPSFRLDCPSRTILDVLGNKWVLYVLGLLERHDRPLRFNELRRTIEGVTQKSLTQTLRTLERDGLVDRKVYATVPPRVEYRLTHLGREVGRLTGTIARWALENAPQVIAARDAFDSRPTGETAPTSTPWTVRAS